MQKRHEKNQKINKNDRINDKLEFKKELINSQKIMTNDKVIDMNIRNNGNVTIYSLRNIRILNILKILFQMEVN